MLFNLAVTTLNFIFGLYFLELTGSAFIFGTLIIIGPVVSLMFTPIMTRIVDYYNHRKILILSQLISCGSLLIYWAIGSWIDISKITVAYVLMIIIRISEELFIVTFKASVPQITDQEHFQKINAAMQSATSIANMAGPIIGGVAYGVFSLRLFILLISVTIIISTLFTISIQFKPEKMRLIKRRAHF
ncbi:MFS transporter [Weissella fangxianensis]|uniref:MFS transporter n=1 Tax=Weissella fangxianensis TaxID=2953879 RepID=UPI0021577F7B|nr:MFS transporter [Weissella fangxianensis]